MKVKWRKLCLLVLCPLIWRMGAAVARAQATAPVRIVANVELVEIPVIIFDDKGAVATNLKKAIFGVSMTELNREYFISSGNGSRCHSLFLLT